MFIGRKSFDVVLEGDVEETPLLNIGKGVLFYLFDLETDWLVPKISASYFESEVTTLRSGILTVFLGSLVLKGPCHLEGETLGNLMGILTNASMSISSEFWHPFGAFLITFIFPLRRSYAMHTTITLYEHGWWFHPVVQSFELSNHHA